MNQSDFDEQSSIIDAESTVSLKQAQHEKPERRDKAPISDADKTRVVKRSVYTSAAVNDAAATTDEIGFAPYVNALAQMMLHKDTSTPLTVGLYGRWGGGKTSFMRQVDSTIKALQDGKSRDVKLCRVWFEAWKYHNVEELSTALMASGLRSLEQTATLRQRFLYRVRSALSSFRWTTALWNIMLASAAVYFMQYEAQWKALSALPLVGMFFSQSSRDFVSRLSLPLGIDAKAIFSDVFSLKQSVCIDTFSDRLTGYLRNILGEQGRLVVFIDDLDRCSPKHVVSVLETLNVLMDAKGCIFVLGIDEQKVIHSIETYYKDIAAKHNDDQDGKIPFGKAFLEKIIQLPIRLPRVNDAELSHWIGKMLKMPTGRQPEELPAKVSGSKVEAEYLDVEYGPEFKRIVQQVLIHLQPRSPRLVKRYLNRLRLIYLLYASNQEIFGSIDENYLPVWLLLSEHASVELHQIMQQAKTKSWQGVTADQFSKSCKMLDELDRDNELKPLLPSLDAIFLKQENVHQYLSLTML